MTRVVVQRGSAPSNSSQPRSSSASEAPTPPPLPPPFVPPSFSFASSGFSRSSSPPSSSRNWAEEERSKDSREAESHPFADLEGVNSDACFKFLACHYSDAKLRDGIPNLPEGRSTNEAFVHGETASELEGKGLQSISDLSTSHTKVEQSTKENTELCLLGEVDLTDHGEEPSECRTVSFEFEGLRMQQEDIGSQNIQADFSEKEKLEGEGTPSLFGQNIILSAQLDSSTSVELPQSSQESLHSQCFCPGSTQLPYSTAPFLTASCGSESGLLRHQEEILDQLRPISSQKMVQTTACSYLPASWALPVPPGSRRGNWAGSLLPNASRIGGSSRRVPRNIKTSKSSPHTSRSTSPRSYGEGDGYNSSDEQKPWVSGSSVFEDNDEREQQFEIEIRRAKGLEIRRMSEDGNCLFRAVADQVYGDTEMHKETRQMCIDYMEKERDHFSQFVTESFTAYCKRKRRDKVYGNNLEIQAMGEMYNRPIHIYSYTTEPINIFQASYETDLPPIRLSYHRGNHYNSLVDPCKPTVGAGLGFGSLNGANAHRDQVKAAIKAQQDQQIEKALLAEGRYYSDLELTEREMEHMVIEASRAEFLAKEHRQHSGWMESSTSAGAEPSSSAAIGISKGQGDLLAFPQAVQEVACPVSYSSFSEAVTDPGLTSNMRMLLSMGFSYLKVLEAYRFLGDDVNNMLCYLLEAESDSPHGDCVYRMKGKAAEK